jgi:hypothetical protein
MIKIKEFTPLPGENVLTQINGTMSGNPNPFIQLLMFFVKIIRVIFGVIIRISVIVTDKRIVTIEKQTVLWGIWGKSVQVSTWSKTNILSVGHSTERTWIFFRKHLFTLVNASEIFRIIYKGSKANLLESCRILEDEIH